MSNLALRARGLEVAIGERRLVGPLDCELEQHSWTLLVGPSGCGKTSLLRAIAGLLQPRAGELELDGRLVSRGARILVPAEKRGIGMVFQGAGAGLWPHMSARATLEIVLGCRGVPRRERAAQADQYLARVRLEALAERKPGELSGGEAQRLSLARALAMQPRLLLLDEPLGPLDRALRSELIDELERLHHSLSLTILHVTHDPQELSGRAGKTLRMEHGRWIGQDG